VFSSAEAVVGHRLRAAAGASDSWLPPSDAYYFAPIECNDDMSTQLLT
jgi:hypothetical protein